MHGDSNRDDNRPSLVAAAGHEDDEVTDADLNDFKDVVNSIEADGNYNDDDDDISDVVVGCCCCSCY